MRSSSRETTLLSKAEITAIKFFDRAMEHVRDKEYARALDHLKTALKKFDANPSFHYVSGYIHHQQHEIEKAKPCYTRTLQLDPRNTECLWNLALIHLEEKNFTEAIKYWNLLLDACPQDIETRVNLGLAYYHMNELNQAVHEFKEILKYDPENFEAHKNLGLIAKEQKKYDEVVKLFSKLPKIDPTFEGAIERELLEVEHLKLEEQLTRMEKDQDTYRIILRELADEGIDVDSESYEDLITAALSANIEGNPMLAIEKARIAARKPESDYTPYQILFQSNLALENLPEAEAAIKKAIELEPGMPELYNDQANLFMYQKRYRLALEAFKKVQEIDPRFPFVRENIRLASEKS